MPNSTLIALAIGVLLGVALLPYVPGAHRRVSADWFEPTKLLMNWRLLRYEPRIEHEQLRFE